MPIEIVDASGRKDDSGKIRWDLMPSDVQEEVARVLTYGAARYSARNWEKGMSWSRPFAAMMRHAWKWWRGETIDPETGISHMAHAICNGYFLLAYELRGMRLYDDRERLGDRDPRALHAGHGVITPCPRIDGEAGV